MSPSQIHLTSFWERIMTLGQLFERGSHICVPFWPCVRALREAFAIKKIIYFPTDSFPNEKPQNQEIGVFSVLYERRAKDFDSQKLWKGRRGGVNFTLFSNGIVFRSLTNAKLTAWTLRRSLAFLLATRWAGFSQWGTCLYELFFFNNWVPVGFIKQQSCSSPPSSSSSSSRSPSPTEADGRCSGGHFSDDEFLTEGRFRESDLDTGLFLTQLFLLGFFDFGFFGFAGTVVVLTWPEI